MNALKHGWRPRQLPFQLGHAPAFSRDDLIVSKTNEAAVALIDRWPDWPAAVTVLAGPTGSGKSHIASVWREAADAAALDARTIGPDAIAAAGQGPVLIDDVDRREIDEEGLFHLINAVRQAGGSMLLCSRRFPSAWGVTLPDLVSRLRAAATVEIGEPDDALLSGVIAKLFADRQVEVEHHVIQFVARRIERSLSTVIRMVEALDHAALERRSRVTRALAAEVIAALESAPPRQA